jgi:nucleotide-binding universal stress UspA family protein
MINSSVLVGFQPDRRGADALALGTVLLRGGGGLDGVLTVANVRPPGWRSHTKARVDAEWEAYLNERARATLDRAREQLAASGRPELAGVATYLVGIARGSGRGLAGLARTAQADVIVIGSAPGGPRNGISIGSTADQLLHGSPVPVMLAPKAYAGRRLDSFDRITVAYLRSPRCDDAVALAAQVAAQSGVRLRLLTVVVGPRARGRVARLAKEQLRRMTDDHLADLAAAARAAAAGSALTGQDVRIELVRGSGVAKAIMSADWSPGELLVIASSGVGPLRKVFMGDMALKILRAVPCPAIVLPRTTRERRFRS